MGWLGYLVTAKLFSKAAVSFFYLHEKERYQFFCSLTNILFSVFLMTNDTEHFFMCLLAIYILSFQYFNFFVLLCICLKKY